MDSTSRVRVWGRSCCRTRSAGSTRSRRTPGPGSGLGQTGSESPRRRALPTPVAVEQAEPEAERQVGGEPGRRSYRRGQVLEGEVELRDEALRDGYGAAFGGERRA